MVLSTLALVGRAPAVDALTGGGDVAPGLAVSTVWAQVGADLVTVLDTGTGFVAL